MAVLGVQLVFSMITASILSKLSGHYSFGRWVLCSRLARYLHPSDEELRKLAGNGIYGYDLCILYFKNEKNQKMLNQKSQIIFVILLQCALFLMI